MSFATDLSTIINAILFIGILTAALLQYRNRSNHFLAFFFIALLNTGLRIYYLVNGNKVDGLSMDDSVLLIQLVNVAFIFTAFRMIHSLKQEDYSGENFFKMFNQ